MKQRVLLVTTIIVLLGLLAAGTGCGGPRKVVKLNAADVSAVVGEGSVTIGNVSNETWTNVRLVLNESFADIIDKLAPGETVTLPAADFTHEGEAIDPAAIGHGLFLQMTCDLPGQRAGAFSTVWH